MNQTIRKCAGCDVPERECIGKGDFIGYHKSCSLDRNDLNWDWFCDYCVEGRSINCSHCNDSIKGILPDPLDDGSFLCKKCDTDLIKELDKLK